VDPAIDHSIPLRQQRLNKWAVRNIAARGENDFENTY
jgi:hypothetical protein